MYEQEVVDQEAKIEKMKADNKDAYDIKKQVRWFMVVCCIRPSGLYLGGVGALAPLEL